MRRCGCNAKHMVRQYPRLGTQRRHDHERETRSPSRLHIVDAILFEFVESTFVEHRNSFESVRGLAGDAVPLKQPVQFVPAPRNLANSREHVQSFRTNVSSRLPESYFCTELDGCATTKSLSSPRCGVVNVTRLAALSASVPTRSWSPSADDQSRRGSVGSGVRAEDTVSERRDTLSEPAPETKYRVRYPSHVC